MQFSSNFGKLPLDLVYLLLIFQYVVFVVKKEKEKAKFQPYTPPPNY